MKTVTLGQIWKIFKTIKLGTGLKTAVDFRQALKNNGFFISDWANDILGEPAFTAASEETEKDIVVISVAELGFKKGAVQRDIYKRARELGLELCPAEVGPQLRLQYADQLMNERQLLIAMETITAPGGCLRVFSMGRDGFGPWFNAPCGAPDSLWSAGHRWVFVNPRK